MKVLLACIGNWTLQNEKRLLGTPPPLSRSNKHAERHTQPQIWVHSCEKKDPIEDRMTSPESWSENWEENGTRDPLLGRRTWSWSTNISCAQLDLRIAMDQWVLWASHFLLLERKYLVQVSFPCLIIVWGYRRTGNLSSWLTALQGTCPGEFYLHLGLI